MFGPDGNRTARSNAFTGLALGQDRNRHQVELKGSCDIEACTACFKVLATTPIMLNACDAPVLLGEGSYCDFNNGLARQLGAKCYLLLYVRHKLGGVVRT